jgi:hypothetical protein
LATVARASNEPESALMRESMNASLPLRGKSLPSDRRSPLSLLRIRRDELAFRGHAVDAQLLRLRDTEVDVDRIDLRDRREQAVLSR